MTRKKAALPPLNIVLSPIAKLNVRYSAMADGSVAIEGKKGKSAFASEAK